MPQSTTDSPAYGAIAGMAAAPKQKGLFLRFIDCLVEARRRGPKNRSLITAT